MIPIVYFAHSIKVYNSQLETDAMSLIEAYFTTYCVFNPNRPYIQKAKDPMTLCLDIIKDDSIQALVFLPGKKGIITPGVNYEIHTARKLHKPIFKIKMHDEEIVEMKEK